MRTRYAADLPLVAGVPNPTNAENWKQWDSRPEKPQKVKVDDNKRKFGGASSRSSDHVPDVLHHPGSSNETFGKGYVRGHKLPEKVKSTEFKFGVKSDKSEAAKALIYPKATEEDSCELYRRSRHTYEPGEQKKRDYRWDLNVSCHTFGRSGSGVASSSVAEVFSGTDAEQAARVNCKRIEAFYSRSTRLARARNLGFDSHLGPEHVYGIVAKRVGGLDGGDVAASIQGSYTWEEQQPDEDLGKAIKPGFRNITKHNRAFGVQNSPDDCNAASLINPTFGSQ